MKWLNINLSTLRSPEYIGSSPVERGTWLSVSSLCADQENGGRVVGGLLWKDRQWQQACGVTLREVQAASRLVFHDGDDVVVFAYPVDREYEIKAKREAGRRGGSSTSEAKVKAVRENGAKAYAKHTLGSAPKLNQSSDLTEGNRKGIGKEEEGQIAAEAAPTAGIEKPKASRMPDTEWLETLKADPAFAGIDIDLEYAKATRWCEEKRKTLSRMRLINWLNRCDRPLNARYAAPETIPENVRIAIANRKTAA